VAWVGRPAHRGARAVVFNRRRLDCDAELVIGAQCDVVPPGCGYGASRKQCIRRQRRRCHHDYRRSRSNWQLFRARPQRRRERREWAVERSARRRGADRRLQCPAGPTNLRATVARKEASRNLKSNLAPTSRQALRVLAGQVIRSERNACCTPLRMARQILTLALAAGMWVAMSTHAAASPLVLRVCDDVACLGGDDLEVIGGPVVTFDALFAGFTKLSLVATTTNGDNPLGIDFSARGPVAARVWVYVSTTDFARVGNLGLHSAVSINIPNDANTVTATMYGGSSNDLFDLSTELLAIRRPGGPVVDQWTKLGLDANPYSLTLALTIDQPGSGRTEGRITTVPEPTSLLLLCLGFGGVTLRRRFTAHIGSRLTIC
jgi:hypothetical protein